ncbi:PD-(D/E)XK nuclease superfamily protein [Amycolatopsis rubida]|uniref:PD-(D/E)XK nuclease superfamily protein n=1 Tax=Amycolatopsis rubida TaxID=112413 RepID=A0A1I6B9V5_9PSEU|nr:PD-(D/E)XK nuclease superfamily protein [Amycolatopsis rubida]
MSAGNHPNCARGSVSGLTVSVGKIGASKFNCPMKDALNAREGLAPERPVPSGRARMEEFGLEPVMRALDQLEGLPGEYRPSAAVHEGHVRWAEHAVRHYQQVFAPAEAGVPQLRPLLGRTWKTAWSAEGQVSKTITAWGRRYASVDGAFCELRPITFRSRDEAKELRELKAQVAAYVIARAEPRAKRIRVVDFACLDGDRLVRFDGPPELAAELYRDKGRKAVTAVVDGESHQPGTACGDCRFIASCPAVPEVPGLLGVPGRPIRRRTWSPSTGRNHQACPARHHLRDRLHLPIDQVREHEGPAERGRAVHRALASAHRRQPARRCSPVPEEGWEPEGLPDSEQELARQLFAEHAEVCPGVHLPATAELRPEHDLVVWDSEADVVVITTPDLLYEEAGSTVWREVKSSRTRRPWRGDPVTKLSQIALAVLMMRHGVLGTGPGQRIELEVLRPDISEVIPVDPFNESVHETARTVIRELVAPWHSDDLFPPNPGERCAACVVARWCPSAMPEARGEA